MDALISMLTDQLGPFGPLIAVGGVGVMLILGVIPFMMRKTSDPLDRLREEVRPTTRKVVQKEQTLRQGGKRDKLEKYSTFLEPQNEEDFSAVKLRLLRAGYRSPNAVRIYHFAQFALGIGLLIFGVALAILKSATGEPTTQALILSVLIPGAAGYMLPKYWVTRRLESRKELIIQGFPDALDLMLVCVEAGQSMDQSIVRVAREIRAGYPPLADEFDIVSFEMKAGKDKSNVLRDLSERAGVQDISSFVTVLIQSQTFGTSIADALRVYAGEMRDKRVMRAEEAANKLPTKMTLATMMLTVPPLLIILVGPSVYGIFDLMKQAGG